MDSPPYTVYEPTLWTAVPGLEGNHKVDERGWPVAAEILQKVLAKHGAQQAQECRVHTWGQVKL